MSELSPDLVQRLRFNATPELVTKAADRIEELETLMEDLIGIIAANTVRIEKLETALRAIVDREDLDAFTMQDIAVAVLQLEKNTATMDMARDRIEKLETALRKIVNLNQVSSRPYNCSSTTAFPPPHTIDGLCASIARAALAPEQDK